MIYQYELVNTEGMTDEQIEHVEKALETRAYVCQKEFEKQLDLYHEINVLADANDEAFVSKLSVEKDPDGDADWDICRVEIDCRRVVF